MNAARLMNPVTDVLLQPKPPPPPPPFSSPPLLVLPRPRLPLTSRHRTLRVTRAAAAAEVEMVRGCDGVWSARERKVVVLWDLDNKPPRGPPYEAALSLLRLASLFGRVVDAQAYANRHAFVHLPQWVLAQRRERRHLDVLERKGIALPPEPYVCAVCGRKCRTNIELKRHFKQLHERERQKKLARMRSLKGKRRQRYRERFISGNYKYEETARELLTPKSGYGLATELRRAGVVVRTVADKPQAADAALKRQMQHSMARRIDWMFLVSDDSDFADMVQRAREAELRTVVVGDGRTVLGQHADLWVPWMGVENGEVGEEVLVSARNGALHNGTMDLAGEEGLYSSASFYEDGGASDLDDVVDEIVIKNSGFGGVRISAFSEEEMVEGTTIAEDLGGDDASEILESRFSGEDFYWDSEEEEDGYI